jgi:hypothetical protein
VEKWDNFAFRLPAITSRHTFRSRSGSLAMLAAMRLASSLVSRSAAVRRPGSFSKTEVGERGGGTRLHAASARPVNWCQRSPRFHW